MKPMAVIESLRLTYDTLYMNQKFTEMLEGAYPNASEEEKNHLTRFLFDGFAFNKVMQWQPHKDWYVADVKEFLALYKEHFDKKDVSGYAMVLDFFKQLGTYTAEMLKEPPAKDEYPFWFLAAYLRPAMNS